MFKVGMLAVVVLTASFSFAQDSIRVLYYNILNFPESSPERVADFRKICQYAAPDIIVVNELQSETGANLLLEDGLNVYGVSNYEAATFVDGPDTDNLLFYNADLLGLVSQEQIPTGLREISEYKLYYKSPGLSADSDTIYLQLFSAHLKAGSGHFNQRKTEILQLKFRLNALENQENIIVGGDFNFYSGNESGCSALLESGDVDLFDPIDQIGNWSGNPSYASIHTQSTRSSPLADGSGGGMDDRFDLIVVSEDVFNNENGVTYIEGSYQALGQDGDRFNQSINAPYNPSVPDSISEALFFMSDHLPVMLDLKMDYTANTPNFNLPELKAYFSNTTKELVFTAQPDLATLHIYDMYGRLVYQQNQLTTTSVNLAQLNAGIYLWQLKDEKGQIYRGKIKCN